MDCLRLALRFKDMSVMKNMQDVHTVTKLFLWVYGVNSPTRRIMEDEGLSHMCRKTRST
ncbi:hypothetical protein AVEN_238230-1, partial [Araneus ventricosus]